MGHMPLQRNETVTNPWRLDTSSRIDSAVGRQCERFADSGTKGLRPYPEAKLVPCAA